MYPTFELHEHVVFCLLHPQVATEWLVQLDTQAADIVTKQFLEQAPPTELCEGQLVPHEAEVDFPPHYVPQEAHIVVVRFEGQFKHPTAYPLLQLHEKHPQLVV